MVQTTSICVHEIWQIQQNLLNVYYVQDIEVGPGEGGRRLTLFMPSCSLQSTSQSARLFLFIHKHAQWVTSMIHSNFWEQSDEC